MGLCYLVSTGINDEDILLEAAFALLGSCSETCLSLFKMMHLDQWCVTLGILEHGRGLQR